VRLAPDLDRSAPDFDATYGIESLRADQGKRILSLARLPGWPTQPEDAPRDPRGEPEPAFGHGWGPLLDGMLGHGLAAGEMVAIGASSAGAGKTAFLMQLVDGLALRNLRVIEDAHTPLGPQLTPVILASEMSVRVLSWRSLARWTGHPGYFFRAGRSLLEAPGEHGKRAQAAWRAAELALRPDGDFRRSRRWLRMLDGRESGLLAAEGAGALIEHVKLLAEAWRDRLAREHPGREITPVVVIDPLQRYQAGVDEVRDLNALARELCAAALAGGWIALLTSDTNKAAARGDRGDNGRSDAEEGAAAFRGSYGLIHELSSALYLRRPPQLTLTEAEEREGLRYIEAVLVKNRWGGSAPPWPRFRWYGATGRFWPMTADAIASHDARLAAARDEQRASSDRGARSDPQERPGSGPGAPHGRYPNGLD
jgi:hypothetical protein